MAGAPRQTSGQLARRSCSRAFARARARLRPSALSAAAALAVALASPLVARAEDRPPRGAGAPSEPVPRRVVTVEIAGDERSVADLTSLLRERLASQPIDVTYAATSAIDPAAVVTPADVHDDDLARVWVDLRPGRRVTLYVVDGPWERVFVRHFLGHENPEVTREEIGHVVELALVALAAGERIGVGREVARAELAPAPPVAAPLLPPAPAPAPAADRPPPSAPTEPARTTTRFHVGPFFEAQAYGAGPELRTGIGGVLALRRTPPERRLRYGASVLLQYRFPSDADASVATVRSEGAAAHLLASAGFAISRPAELAILAGPGLEMVHAEARGERASTVSFAAGSSSFFPVARVLARYTHAFPDRFELFAGVGLDVPFDRTRYLLARPGGAAVLFEEWAARPFFVLGVTTP